MPGIAISYRREDTGWITGRIFDRLKDYYERSADKNNDKSIVFLDYDSTPVGVDFRKYIKGVFDDCDILLAIIGPHWMGDDVTGKPRIIRDDDWVHIEIDTALKKNIPVVPILIDRTPMPSKEALPEDIRDLVYRQAAVIDSQIDFNAHMERLIRQIDRTLNLQQAKPQKSFHYNFRATLPYLIIAAVVCVAAIALWIYKPSTKPTPEPKYTVYSSPDLGVTVVFPNNIFSLDTTERKQLKLSFRDDEGHDQILVSRIPLPDHKDIKIGRQQEENDLKKMGYTLTYIAPEKQNNWSDWYVISGLKHGTEFYFRRWYSEDSVVSMEFMYPKEQAPLLDNIITTMVHQFAFTPTIPKT
jgi:TIR domain